MRLTILGGGGFRVPLVHRALLARARQRDLGEHDELVLHDTDATRSEVVAAVLTAQAEGAAASPRVRVEHSLDEALRGADFVFSAVRVGGTAGRVRDERLPLAEGVLGQETVGAGGVLYALRSVPAAMRIAQRVREVAPNAWVINFTNPAGIVTQAMARLLGDRVIGICDSPVGLVRRAARAAGVQEAAVEGDYLGLNHLGWLRSLTLPAEGGRDLLPGLLADDAALASFEEGRLFGGEWLRTLGVLPNEYLHYYYFRRETLTAQREAAETRGDFLDRQQGGFFTAAAGLEPARALELWERTRREREETYLSENRQATGGWERDSGDLDGGGYEQVALALMRALADGESGEDTDATGSGSRPRLILNVAGRGTVPSLPHGAVVETVCEVGAGGARPLPCAPPGAAELGLMLQLKAVEQATIEAADSGSRRSALRALAQHPLVDSPTVAARILDRAGW